MYTEKWNHVVPMAAPGTVTLSSAGLATPTYAVGNQCAITRISAVVTTATTVSASALQFIFRPTPGSSTGQVVIGTLNFPAGASIGQIYYKDITDVGTILAPGGQLVFNVTTTATAGACVATFDVTDSPVNFKALTQCVAST